MQSKTKMIFFIIWLALKIILESFPISSSGHLAIYFKILSLFENTDSLKIVCESVDALLEGITALVVLIFLRKKIRFFFKGIMKRSSLILVPLGYFGLAIFIAGVETAIFYFLFLYTGIAWFPLLLGFVITAMLIFSLRWVPSSYVPLTFKKILFLGFVQGAALLPGISRMASTYVIGRWLGLLPRKAFELSLFLHMPLACATCLFFGFWNLFRHHKLFVKVLNIETVCVMLISMILAYMSLLGVSRLAYKGRWQYFGWYLSGLILVLWYVGFA